MKKRLLSNLVVLLSIAALAPAAAHAAPDQYVPNEIIVKFRETAANTIEKQLQSRDSAGTLNLPRDLERLSTKYRVSRIKPLLKDFRERQQQLKSLRQKNKRLLSQREKRILNRLKRAPTGTKVPDLGRIYKIKLNNRDGQSLEKALDAYRSNPDVEYAELNYIVSVDSTPSDPLYSAQWSLSQINAPEAWDVYAGSSQTIVAVVDSGVDYNHRDLRDNMWINEAELNGFDEVDDDENGYIDDIYGYNFIYNNSDPIDDYGHGTHCSGIIAAKGDNGLDITGICWNTRIMALKFIGPYGDGSSSDAALAFYYAVANGADVISNSWSAKDESKLLEEAINYAYSQGVIIVASAGNGDSDEPVYPAGYQHVISVAATEPNDNKWPGSNYGDWVDIAAPGAGILSLRAEDTLVGKSNDEYTAFLTGTSAACPHIAGACALMLSANPLMTFGQLYNTLMRTADPIEPGTCYSDGRVNLSEAMHAVVPSRGYISFDHEYYTSSGVVSMLLADWDLKGNGSQEVTIMTSGDDLEKVLLTETIPAFGVFTGTISIGPEEPNQEDGTVQVSSDEVFTVVYFDADDSTGRPAATIDSALMDSEAPKLFFVDVQTNGPVANITFLTSEPTSARVQCGPAPGGPYTFVKENIVLDIIHTIKLQPVVLNTDYYFIIDLVDEVGNETIADNNGLCYSFTTPAEFAGFYVPGVYHTIQAAIDDASDGDTIHVADGQYTGEGNIDIDFHGKAITVKSENGPENCIVDCQFQGRGFDFHSGEDENSVLDGLTIINGSVSGFGGGIKCTASSPTIVNCIITRNIAKVYGGGICNSYNSAPTLTNCTFSENSAKSTPCTQSSGGGMCNLENSSPTVSNCLFSENSAFEGSGMYNENSSPTLIDCTFSGNFARDEFTCGGVPSSGRGGGMYNLFFSAPSLTNCTFSGNSAEYGGAIENCESTPKLVNCTISGNSADKMGGGIRNGFDGSSILSNCILWGNSDSYGMDESSQIANMHSNETSVINYCCIQGWTGNLGGIGNFGNDPLFVDPDAGDYHLKSQAWRWDSNRRRWHYDEVTSQCIDAGNPGSPLNAELLGMPDDPDNMWGINLRINMGAYGGTAEASMPPYKWTLLADLNNDGFVNIRDFAAQAQYWLRTEGTPPGDVNRDGIVDTADLALFMEDWLKYIKPPVVNIIKPLNGTLFVMRPVEIEIEAQAWDTNGSVVKVEFFLSAGYIGEDNDGSDGWKILWTEDFARGGYDLTARATDNGGITTISPKVRIQVKPPY